MEDRQRDSQKSKCYAWESSLGVEGGWVKYNDIQPIVDHVWTSEGLVNPPKVKPLPKQTRKHCATGSRLRLRFEVSASNKTILHEIGHAMTMDFDGNGDAHGPRFVGTIMLLYTKYLNLSMTDMMASAREVKLKYEFSESVF